MCTRRHALAGLALTLAACGGDDGGTRPVDARLVDAPSLDAPPGPPPAVIVMIGDGMGPGQLDTASLFRHGATGRLFMQTLPRHGHLHSSGPSGITDSAAAATVMATGVYTLNTRIGLDRRGQPAVNLVEDAHARGWAAGVVTTTAVPTPPRPASPPTTSAAPIWSASPPSR